MHLQSSPRLGMNARECVVSGASCGAPLPVPPPSPSSSHSSISKPRYQYKPFLSSRTPSPPVAPITSSPTTPFHTLPRSSAGVSKAIVPSEEGLNAMIRNHSRSTLKHVDFDFLMTERKKVKFTPEGAMAGVFGKCKISDAMMCPAPDSADDEDKSSSMDWDSEGDVLSLQGDASAAVMGGFVNDSSLECLNADMANLDDGAADLNLDETLDRGSSISDS